MAHMSKFRKGWEKENLARYILSKFSFISHPATVSDDVGTDYFCTLFEKVEKDYKTKRGNIKKDTFIYPKNSFAIQIKSRRNAFDITDKISYYDSLSIPFFIGIVSEKKLSITIYSGDIVPEMFALVGLPKDGDEMEGIKVKIKYCEEREPHGQRAGQTEYTVPFYKIGIVKAENTYEDLKSFIEAFSKLLENYQRNILSKKNDENIYYDVVNDRLSNIVTGPGSWQVCRKNYFERLQELMANLLWYIPNIMNDDDIEKFLEEFNIYKRHYNEIKGFYGEIPEILGLIFSIERFLGIIE